LAIVGILHSRATEALPAKFFDPRFVPDSVPWRRLSMALGYWPGDPPEHWYW